jgi:hypothetical protein
MKKLLLSILGLLLLTSVTIAEESDIQKYNFYWDQVPVVCGAPEEIDRWANDKGFTPLSISYGKEGGDKDGTVVYIVVYYLNKDNGETFATVTTPTGSDVCVIFRTFNLQLNPKIMEEYRPGLNL